MPTLVWYIQYKWKYVAPTEFETLTGYLENAAAYEMTLIYYAAVFEFVCAVFLSHSEL